MKALSRTGLRRLAELFSLLLAASVVAPVPALAVSCRTPGHAYVVSLPSGAVHSSEFEGHGRFGVPVWTTRRGERFQLGGNGIRPGTAITWSTRNAAGQSFGIEPRPPSRATRSCVVHQSPPTYQVTAPPGVHEIHATYTAGNSGWFGDELVAFARVVP